MITLFLDESGDHSLDKIDPQFPVFTLAGCAFDDRYYFREVGPRVAAFKRDLFGDERVVLHTSDITRNRNGFERLKAAEFRAAFYRRLNQLLRELDFTVVAVSIRKEEHLRRHAYPADPYHLSLENILERFYYLLREHDEQGAVVAESRNPRFDADLGREFERLMTAKTTYMRGSRLRQRIQGLTFREKRENLPGLQIADLMATPISRYVIGKRTHEDFRIIEEKFRRSSSGDFQGYGLKVLP